MHLAVETSSLFSVLDADVDFHCRLGSDHIRARTSTDHARIRRNSLLQVVEPGNGGDLTREFDNRAVSFARVEPGMGGDAMNRKRVVADAFAGSFDRTSRTRGGLKDKHGC